MIAQSKDITKARKRRVRTLHLRSSDIELIRDDTGHCGDEETEDQEASVEESVGANEEDDCVRRRRRRHYTFGGKYEMGGTDLQSQLGSTMPTRLGSTSGT